MVRIFGGAIMVVAGIAAFIEAHSHHPVAEVTLSSVPRIARAESAAGVTPRPPSGWSTTTYDVVRIGGWALVIVGVLLVMVGLIAYARRPA